MIYPHGDIETIGENLFMVRGSIQMNPLVRISRNMGIVRHEGQLTLLDPLRLNAEVEGKSLKELRCVKMQCTWHEISKFSLYVI